MSLSASIKSIQDIMRKDVGVDGDAQRLSQLAWMLFLKIFDAQETELEMTRDDYRSPFPQKLRWRNWADDAEGITGDGLMKFINDDLFPGLKELKGSTPRHQLIRSTFEDTYNYMKSGTLLRQVINKLNEGMDFNKSQDRHLFGDIYEQLLRDLQGAGNMGEIYTPRAVTQFMVERTNPRLGEIILDPAGGTGGMLTCSLEHIRKREVKSPADLFLVLIVHLLRDGGRGAIVLPDGTLFGEGIKTRIKQELLEKCNLHTIVRLPNGVFAPYTGIKTNLLFFTKGEPTREIWYYEHPYPPGVKNYNKTKPIRIEEFDAEKKWWGKPGQESKRKETEFAWRVSIADIAARGYNLDVKNPHTVDDAHRDPAELLAEYQKAQAAVAEVREKLRRELETALTR